MHPAEPRLGAQMHAAVNIFSPARAPVLDEMTVELGDRSPSRTPALLIYSAGERRLIVDPLLAEEIAKAEDGFRSPTESAGLLEAMGLIGLRIAANPTSDSEITSSDGVLPLARRDASASASSPGLGWQRHGFDRLLLAGWEGALVRGRLSELSRKTGLLCHGTGDIIRPSALATETIRSTLCWMTGVVLSEVYSNDSRRRERRLFPAVAVDPDAAKRALRIMRGAIPAAGLVQMLVTGIAERYSRSPVEVASRLCSLAEDIAGGTGREQISGELAALLTRPRAKPVYFI